MKRWHWEITGWGKESCYAVGFALGFGHFTPLWGAGESRKELRIRIGLVSRTLTLTLWREQ